MTYDVKPAPLLGPCRCQGCGEPLWWATRQSRYLGNVIDKTAWREEDGTIHRCPNVEPMLALHRARRKHEAILRELGHPDAIAAYESAS